MSKQERGQRTASRGSQVEEMHRVRCLGRNVHALTRPSPSQHPDVFTNQQALGTLWFNVFVEVPLHRQV